MDNKFGEMSISAAEVRGSILDMEKNQQINTNGQLTE